MMKRTFLLRSMFQSLSASPPSLHFPTSGVERIKRDIAMWLHVGCNVFQFYALSNLFRDFTFALYE